MLLAAASVLISKRDQGLMLTASSSLAAAITRLIVQLQISNGRYAAHSNVDRKYSRTDTVIAYFR